MIDNDLSNLTKSQRYRLKDLDSYRKTKREYAKTESQRLKRNAYMKLWKAKNSEKNRAWSRARYQRLKDRYSRQWKNCYYKNKYGITVFEADAMKAVGCCGLCGSKKLLHIDHDHNQTKPSYRGLLCVKCNTHLGWAETVGFAAISAYLKKQNKTW